MGNSTVAGCPTHGIPLATSLIGDAKITYCPACMVVESTSAILPVGEATLTEDMERLAAENVALAALARMERQTGGKCGAGWWSDMDWRVCEMDPGHNPKAPDSTRPGRVVGHQARSGTSWCAPRSEEDLSPWTAELVALRESLAETGNEQ